jgi:hypothetical protein
MAKAIINKHVDNKSGITKNIFIQDADLRKGEIIINNDENEPSIYIWSTKGEPVKISGNNSGGAVSEYDDTAIRAEINEVKSNVEILQGEIEEDKQKSVRTIATEVAEETLGNYTPGSSEDIVNIQNTLVGFDPENTVQKAINELDEKIQNIEIGEGDVVLDDYVQKTTFDEAITNINTSIDNLNQNDSLQNEDISNLKTLMETLNGEEEGSIKKSIQDVKNTIDAYTINGIEISNNPEIQTDNLKISNNYSTINKNMEDILPEDILTDAISKLEIALANTTLALSAAINDIENRIGQPSKKDDNGNVINEASGIYKLIEDLNK